MSNITSQKKTKPPDNSTNQTLPQNGNQQIRKWREWHEREVPVKIIGKKTRTGIKIKITSRELNRELALNYPNSIWTKFPNDNKQLLLDNIAYIFTAHLPFLLKGNIRLEYATGYPHSFLWANQAFVKHLPSYWYLYRARRGTGIMPMLKTILNSRAIFSQRNDIPPSFPDTIDENVIIPFTFGKDSFLTYHLAKEIGLSPLLLWFNDPVDEGYEGKHKQKLFKDFSRRIKDKCLYLDNPLGSLREKGEGWFGWELSMTSWALLSLPFAYKYKSGYIIYSNERSVNSFFYDDEGVRVLPDYEQTAQATEEMSLLTQALSEGEVYTTTFLQGIDEIAVLAILKTRYPKDTFRFLMSCWSETDFGKNKRWCGHCSKCARIYVYLTAIGVNPRKEAGFEDDMFDASKKHLFNVFGQKATGTGWDAFGLNTNEQSLAFYLSCLRGYKHGLLKEFKKSPLFLETRKKIHHLLKEYFSLHSEQVTPPQWKKKIDNIIRSTLQDFRTEIFRLVDDR
ncbi:hypothetical protein A3D03_05670 [Candidatus Gottesmanbacteria bacterium RIFCSPHIGHO2_02_FULL_40_13]|uniref:UDP-N-acetyl-alpha-D-muramoyl-L-alanyl-L-glutamate epimerase n=1 Tax=Candidatus Gottesmanbacteria bacterium RIFCSPHIGHO2_02_FULL_40_13 TaxID=1798384 RepID=A0A1F6A9C0_9BACT|nr:MAG: hypothetical protein A3D03_05670 [Candidatus Gottesmanbacteria bacterium RIFCSPHIGHO2_02_FULL_40_13]